MQIPQDAARWQLDPKVRFRKVLDEAVLIHQDRAEVMVLNETAHAFLECCQDGLNFAESVSRMLGEYEVERTELEADLAECIVELENRGVIHLAA
jgi:hypothetical protein